MLDQLTAEDFSPLIGHQLQIDAADGSITATVVDVTTTPVPPEAGLPRDPFNVLLEGPLQPQLEQGIHRLLHPTAGPLELFLVPLQPTQSAARYELVFG
jgi:hypothetical protein